MPAHLHKYVANDDINLGFIGNIANAVVNIGAQAVNNLLTGNQGGNTIRIPHIVIGNPNGK